MNAHTLADEFLDLTDEMARLKVRHRRRRETLARIIARKHADMLEEERALSMRRARVALRMTQTGQRLEDLGRMVGVSGPFICKLAQRAREEAG